MMMTEEEYKKELIRMFDSLRKNHKGEDSCLGINCEQCPFRNDEYTCNDLTAFDAFKIVEIVTKWSKEHPIHYYVSQLEYDIILSKVAHSSSGFMNNPFGSFYDLSDLLKKGYFKGATLNTDIVDYFNHCEVVDK